MWVRERGKERGREGGSECVCVVLQVLVEPGNSTGFQNILEARDMLLDVRDY